MAICAHIGCSENSSELNRKPTDKASFQGTLSNFHVPPNTEETGQVLRHSTWTLITKVRTTLTRGGILRLICRGLLCFLRDMVTPHTDRTAEKRLCFFLLRASSVALRRLLLRLGSPISGRRIPHDPPAL